MVVDDRHLVAGEEQLLRRDLLGPVGVHHHQQAVGVGQNQRVLGGDEGLCTREAESFSTMPLAGFWPDSRMMWAGTPFRQTDITPAAAPMQSKSGYL